MFVPIFDVYAEMDPEEFAEKIAYEQDGTIYTINGDGSGLPYRIADGHFPSWSPDGTKIAYSDNSYQLHITEFSGSETNEFNVASIVRHPSWSPDGTKIAYDDGVHIYTVNSDGSGHPLQITDTYGVEPSWSPDGQKLAYESRCRNIGTCIMIIDSDGSGNPQRISKEPFMEDPAWNPLFSDPPYWIAVSYNTDQINEWSENLGNVQILAGSRNDWESFPFAYGASASNPSWNKDGTKIAFEDNNKIYINSQFGNIAYFPLEHNQNPVKSPSWGLVSKSLQPIPSVTINQEKLIPDDIKSPIDLVNNDSGITASINQGKLLPGDEVIVRIHLSDLTSDNVALSLTGPNENIIMSRVITVNENGNAEFKFRLQDTAPPGEYKIILTQKSEDRTFKKTVTFNVVSIPQFSPMSANVDIISVQPMNQQGNQVDFFTRGTQGYAKVILSGNSPSDILTTVNLFAKDSTSMGLASFRGSLDSESEIMFSFYIPTNTITGEATLFANVYSDWPTNGGVPLTPEMSANVNIVD